MDAVVQMRNSIGYASLDAFAEATKSSLYTECKPKQANIINKAGMIVNATINSAQAAVRSRAFDIIRSSCPGFGMCGSLEDAEDKEAWPLTALSVNICFVFPAHCKLYVSALSAMTQTCNL